MRRSDPRLLDDESLKRESNKRIAPPPPPALIPSETQSRTLFPWRDLGRRAYDGHARYLPQRWRLLRVEPPNGHAEARAPAEADAGTAGPIAELLPHGLGLPNCLEAVRHFAPNIAPMDRCRFLISSRCAPSAAIRSGTFRTPAWGCRS